MSIGRVCTGAWEEEGDTCTVAYDMTCDQTHGSSDALCECGESLFPEDHDMPTSFHLISANDQTRALSFGRLWEINDEWNLYAANSFGLGSLANAAAFRFNGTYVSYLDDEYLGLHCNCGVYEEGNSCILIRSRVAPKSEGGQSRPMGQNGDEWIKNDDGTLSPISAPQLVLGFGPTTRKCPGNQYPASEDMGLFLKGSLHRVVVSPEWRAPTDGVPLSGQEAEDACRFIGKKLCHFNELCPHGEGKSPVGMPEDHTDWMPFSDDAYGGRRWIQAGCGVHEQQYCGNDGRECCGHGWCTSPGVDGCQGSR